MRQLVRHRPVQKVRRLVERQQHPIALRLSKRRDTLDGGARDDVLLLELAARLEDDQRYLESKVVLQVGADVLVRAFGVARDPFEVLFFLGVEVNLEVIGGVDVPPEIRVPDLVFAEVRDHRRLRERL